MMTEVLRLQVDTLRLEKQQQVENARLHSDMAAAIDAEA